MVFFFWISHKQAFHLLLQIHFLLSHNRQVYRDKRHQRSGLCKNAVGNGVFIVNVLHKPLPSR